MQRIVLLATALVLAAVLAPPELSPVGDARAQCYDVIEELGCFNPCSSAGYLVWRATGQEVTCTE